MKTIAMMVLLTAVALSTASAQTNVVTNGLVGADFLQSPTSTALRDAIKKADDAYTQALVAIPELKTVLDALAALETQKAALLAQKQTLEQKYASTLAAKKAAKENARKTFFDAMRPPTTGIGR